VIIATDIQVTVLCVFVIGGKACSRPASLYHRAACKHEHIIEDPACAEHAAEIEGDVWVCRYCDDKCPDPAMRHTCVMTKMPNKPIWPTLGRIDG
jgi:hypothetical protein